MWNCECEKASKKGLLRCYSLITFIMVRGYLAVKAPWVAFNQRYFAAYAKVRSYHISGFECSVNVLLEGLVIKNISLKSGILNENDFILFYGLSKTNLV